MGKPVWEYQIRWEYEDEEKAEAYEKVRDLGSEERAARAVWETNRAEFVAAPSRRNWHAPDGSAVRRVVFEARKVVEWSELDDTTPEYARAEEEGAEDAPTS